jgi:hypothetical protein
MRTNLSAKRHVVPVKESLELVPAPLPVYLAEQALRHARRLDHAEALQDCRLVRHELPQEVLALRYVSRAHSAADARHVTHHLLALFIFIQRGGVKYAKGSQGGHVG